RLMLGPPTAPRWNKQTSVGRSDGRTVGRIAEKAARPRNNGSKPRLKRARTPDFTKTRRVMVIALPLGPTVRRSDRPTSLPLKVWAAKGESDRQSSGLPRIADV